MISHFQFLLTMVTGLEMAHIVTLRLTILTEFKPCPTSLLLEEHLCKTARCIVGPRVSTPLWSCHLTRVHATALTKPSLSVKSVAAVVSSSISPMALASHLSLSMSGPNCRLKAWTTTLASSTLNLSR